MHHSYSTTLSCPSTVSSPDTATRIDVLADETASPLSRGGVLSAIGSTPLIELDRLMPESGIRLFGKLEFLNPGGSIKDRTALAMLEDALASGKVRPGDTVVESSSGNMAIGLAQMCCYHGLRLIVVVDPKLNRETYRILRAYGADIELVSEPLDDGGFLGARLQRVEELVGERGVGNRYWPNQYRNASNPRAHERTMREIVRELGGAPDYIFVATSTCGTLMGCHEYLESIDAPTRIVAVDACGSVLFGVRSGERKIPGHGAGRPSHFLDRSACHSVMHVSDRDCVEGCRRMVKREAILAGGSSGGVASAVRKFFRRMPSAGAETPVCVMLLCDRGERYLGTIYDDDWVDREIPQVSKSSIPVKS